MFHYKDGANSMSDIDQASVSQSRSKLDQSALSNSRYNDDGESESGLEDASVDRRREQ